MKRHLFVILLFLTACFAVVCNSNNCCYDACVCSANPTADRNEREAFALLTADKDCAIPVQVQKIELNVFRLSVKQQLKRLAESVFGQAANIVSSYCIAQRIIGSRRYFRSLESYDIGFPFSSFW